MTDCATREPRAAFRISDRVGGGSYICVPEDVVYGSVAAHLAYSQAVLLCLDVVHDKRLDAAPHEYSTFSIDGTVDDKKTVGEVAREKLVPILMTSEYVSGYPRPDGDLNYKNNWETAATALEQAEEEARKRSNPGGATAASTMPTSLKELMLHLCVGCGRLCVALENSQPLGQRLQDCVTLLALAQYSKDDHLRLLRQLMHDVQNAVELQAAAAASVAGHSKR